MDNFYHISGHLSRFDEDLNQSHQGDQSERIIGQIIEDQ